MDSELQREQDRRETKLVNLDREQRLTRAKLAAACAAIRRRGGLPDARLVRRIMRWACSVRYLEDLMIRETEALDRAREQAKPDPRP